MSMIKIIYSNNNTIDEDMLYSTFAEIITDIKSREEGEDTDEI